VGEPAVFFVPISSQFGQILLVWSHAASGRRIVRIILPRGRESAEAVLRDEFPLAIRRSHSVIKKVQGQVIALLRGGSVAFSLELLDFTVCSDFQRRVLLQEFQVPRGRVTSYGRLADKIGSPRAARAVGSALARNPFPLIIPCHRCVRGNGQLGGFRGGLPMKRALLEMEGVDFDKGGRVLGQFIW
jgi:methylated-DNA-[protein]-cysteine S-methyltransferase